MRERVLRKLFKRVVMTLTVSSLLLAPAFAAPITIDDFTTPNTNNPPYPIFPQQVSVTPVGAAGTSATASNEFDGVADALSGSRDMWIEGTLDLAGLDTATGVVVGAPPSAAGYLQFINGNDIHSTLVLQYDGDDDDPVNIGSFAPMDLTSAGTNNRIDLGVLSADPGFPGQDVDVRITVFSTAGSSVLTQSMGIVVPGSPIVKSFNFGSFAGTADFSLVTAVQVEVMAQRGGDLSLSSIQAVPEPGTMAILGFAVVGVAARRRKAGRKRA